MKAARVWNYSSDSEPEEKDRPAELAKPTQKRPRPEPPPAPPRKKPSVDQLGPPTAARLPAAHRPDRPWLPVLHPDALWPGVEPACGNGRALLRTEEARLTPEQRAWTRGDRPPSLFQVEPYPPAVARRVWERGPRALAAAELILLDAGWANEVVYPAEPLELLDDEDEGDDDQEEEEEKGGLPLPLVAAVRVWAAVFRRVVGVGDGAPRWASRAFHLTLARPDWLANLATEHRVIARAGGAEAPPTSADLLRFVTHAPDVVRPLRNAQRALGVAFSLQDALPTEQAGAARALWDWCGSRLCPSGRHFLVVHDWALVHMWNSLIGE